MKNEFIKEVYEELGLQDPDWIPEEYEKAIKYYANSFSGKNQLPVKDGNGQYMYPINRTLITNRVANQLMKALINCENVPETNKGVELLLTKNPKYSIMLNGQEERFLCKAMQDSKNIKNQAEREYVRSQLINIIITFLSPRIKFVYKRFEKAIGACEAYEDVIQELIFATLSLVEDFNFERTTAGITKDYMNLRMCRAINIALSANRSSKIAQETWNKVSKFVNHPEDHYLSRDEIKEKYHCSTGLVDIMLTFVNNGSLEVSIDYNPSDKDGNVTNTSKFGDSLPSKDNSSEEIELDMTLQRILNPMQYKVVKLKMKGYNHKTIANILGFDSKRKSQYIFLLARNIIKKEYKVDISQYSKCKAMLKKEKQKETNKIDQIVS